MAETSGWGNPDLIRELSTPMRNRTLPILLEEDVQRAAREYVGTTEWRDAQSFMHGVEWALSRIFDES
jgi:hypothetical protein